MIFTITNNPSPDRALNVPELHPRKIHRVRLLREDLCRKSINVSRGPQVLGILSRILGLPEDGVTMPHEHGCGGLFLNSSTLSRRRPCWKALGLVKSPSSGNCWLKSQ